MVFCPWMISGLGSQGAGSALTDERDLAPFSGGTDGQAAFPDRWQMHRWLSPLLFLRLL